MLNFNIDYSTTSLSQLGLLIGVGVAKRRRRGRQPGDRQTLVAVTTDLWRHSRSERATTSGVRHLETPQVPCASIRWPKYSNLDFILLLNGL